MATALHPGGAWNSSMLEFDLDFADDALMPSLFDISLRTGTVINEHSRSSVRLNQG